jgi:hypothetical protein
VWGDKLAKLKMCWELYLALFLVFLSQHGCHLKLESENYGPSPNFRGEEM